MRWCVGKGKETANRDKWKTAETTDVYYCFFKEAGAHGDDEEGGGGRRQFCRGGGHDRFRLGEVGIFFGRGAGGGGGAYRRGPPPP